MSDGQVAGLTEPTRGGTSRLLRVRRASLRAVARLHDDPEPSDGDCDGASWDAGLAGAYRSLPGRSMAVAAVASSSPVQVQAPIYRPPLVWALGVGLAAFVLLLTTAPTAALWETRGHLPLTEVLGVPNAPQSPPFVALARVSSLLLSPLAAFDVRLTLFALTVFGALAAVSYLLVHRVVEGVLARVRGTTLTGLGRARSAAVALALLVVVAALGRSGWILAAGSPWALTAALLVAGVWLLLRARDRAHETVSRRYRFAGAYLLILGSTSWSLTLLPLGCAALLVLRLSLHIDARVDRWFDFRIEPTQP